MRVAPESTKDTAAKKSLLVMLLHLENNQLLFSDVAA
jgi:hypothetical protein